MADQILELNGLLQSILTDIENNMPAALSPKVFFPIKEEPISDTEAVRGHSSKLSFPNNHTPSHTLCHTLCLSHLPLHHPTPPTLSVHFTFPHTVGNSILVECLYLRDHLRDFP